VVIQLQKHSKISNICANEIPLIDVSFLLRKNKSFLKIFEHLNVKIIVQLLSLAVGED
jgi:hypothetical protein